MRYLRSKNRMVLLVVLLLMTAANTPYGIVLCFGPGGHIAIEPAGHTHCGPVTGTPDSPACLADPSDPPDDEHNHCCPCTDIPISAGTSRHQIVPGTPGIDILDLLAGPAFAGPMPDDGTYSPASAPAGFLTSRYRSLRSVVLLV